MQQIQIIEISIVIISEFYYTRAREIRNLFITTIEGELIADLTGRFRFMAQPSKYDCERSRRTRELNENERKKKKETYIFHIRVHIHARSRSSEGRHSRISSFRNQARRYAIMPR